MTASCTRSKKKDAPATVAWDGDPKTMWHAAWRQVSFARPAGGPCVPIVCPEQMNNTKCFAAAEI
jgi:hypothetical protein